MTSMHDYVHKLRLAANPVDTARLAEEAIKAPSLFFYGSILEIPSVQELRTNPSFAWIPQVLEILCYGMVSEMHRLPAGVQEHLTPLVYNKMSKLSVLSLCNRDDADGVLHIREVQQAIGAATTSEVEGLLIDMMSEGLLSGRIDHRGGVMVLQEFSAREVQLGDVSKIREKLEAWCRNCDAQIDVLVEMMKE